MLRRNRPLSGPKSLFISRTTSKSPYCLSVMMMPPLPGMSWLPMMAPSSTTHLPPVLFLLAPLWPVLALTCQPLSVLPSKMDTKPLSSRLVLRVLGRHVGRQQHGQAGQAEGKGSRFAVHGELLVNAARRMDDSIAEGWQRGSRQESNSLWKVRHDAER